MTNKEYYTLYKNSQKIASRILINGRKEIRDLYIRASKYASEAAKEAIKKGLSELTSESWANIENQLTRGADIIRNKVPSIVETSIRNITKYPKGIEEEYLISALKDAGVSSLGVKNLFVGVDDNLILSLYSRISQDGYTFSERVWRTGLYYQDRIKNVVKLGLSQGRDMIDIARDIDLYVRSNKKTLLKKIGNLKRGTSEFAKRIGKDVDYNSIRILRSELYASLQEGAKIFGDLNPGCTNYYDWIRTFIEDFNCVCPEYEENSPYSLNDVPSYPHSNCSCLIRPILRDRAEFVNDLENWSNGESIPYLDDWARSKLAFVA